MSTHSSNMKVIKVSLFLLFFGAVSYFTFRGFQQLLDKPISTKTDYRFGDDSRGNLDVLTITICPFSENSPFIKGFQKYPYSLKNILHDSIPDWNISENLIYLSLAHDSNWTYLKGTSTWLPKWYPIMDWQYGHCFVFDPILNGAESVPIIAHARSSKSQVQTLALKILGPFMVSMYDPKAIFTYAKNGGNNIIHFWEDRVGFHRYYRIQKKVIKSISTEEHPCYEQMYYVKNSCIEEKATLKFLEKTGCILPWMKLLHPSVEICNEEINGFQDALQEFICSIHEIEGFFNETTFDARCPNHITEDCPDLRSCHEIDLEQTQMNSKPDLYNESILRLYWPAARITYIEDFVSYDMHNLIGEVGGFLGLFLGFSFTSIFTWIEWIQEQRRNRIK